MIWKYKRCYQEESFTPPPPETDCFKLISIQLYSVINPPLPGSVSSISLNINRCTNVYESTNIPEGVLTPIGFCIQPTSIEIDTVLAGITVPQVENAIANSSGVINIPIIVGEDTVANVTFTFGICGEEQPPNALAIRSNPINDFNLLICEEPMLNDCKIYVQSGTDVITSGVAYPTTTGWVRDIVLPS